MVKSNSIFSASRYIELVSGEYVTICGDDDIEEIHKLLREFGIETEQTQLWDYPLNEIDEVSSDTPVVLVECLAWAEEFHMYEKSYRWFELPSWLKNCDLGDEI